MLHRLFLVLLLTLVPLWATDSPAVILVTGAPGTDEYQTQFFRWASQWKSAAQQGGADFQQIAAKPTQRDDLKTRLTQTATVETSAPLWLVLIGHGTFDGRTAKFNLHGPDLTTAELKTWLAKSQRPIAVINCASSSAPFLNTLSGPNRVILTATRSGAERNFCRLGGYLSRAIASPTADLDKDGQTSLLEAWLTATRQTAEFYKNENRLSPEHALLDDNGDGKGTPPEWFRGIRVTQESADPKLLPDGLRAHQLHLVPSPAERTLTATQRAQRDTLDLELARLRTSKMTLEPDAYYAKLEQILRQLAHIYHSDPATP